MPPPKSGDESGKTLRRLKPPHSTVERTWLTRVVLATAHRDHDPQNNDGANLVAFASDATSCMTRRSTCGNDG